MKKVYLFSSQILSLTVLIYFKAKKAGDRQPEYQIKTGIFWGWLLILMFSLGFIYQFVYLSTG